jgi:NAD-dependent dihydropyrimidine dehydrogenase PreA subunit
VAYIIAEPCIGTKATDCVDVCPVDSIHPQMHRRFSRWSGIPALNRSDQNRAEVVCWEGRRLRMLFISKPF